MEYLSYEAKMNYQAMLLSYSPYCSTLSTKVIAEE